MYAIFEVSGRPKHHAFDSFWKQKPQTLGTWPPWVALKYSSSYVTVTAGSLGAIRNIGTLPAPCGSVCLDL